MLTAAEQVSSPARLPLLFGRLVFNKESQMVIQNGDLDNMIEERKSKADAASRQQVRVEGANYRVHLYLRSNKVLDGYFHCTVCHYESFLEEAIEDGEAETTEEGGTVWICPICGPTPHS